MATNLDSKHGDPFRFEGEEDEGPEDEAVTRFRQYLRIRTVQPHPDYAEAERFLRSMGDELGLHVTSVELVPGKPIVVLTWPGTLGHAPLSADAATAAAAPPSADDNPKLLKSLVLNSHMDVVPVFPEQWSCDPFAAIKRGGKIYARGSQDMKCVGMQYLEAIRILKQQRHYRNRRDVHVLFVPDEEIGGHDGMALLVQNALWNRFHAGFVLDEGLANPDDAYKVYYGERAPWWIKVIIQGETGHGSQFIPNTPGPKMHRMLGQFLRFREEQEKRLSTERHPDGRPLQLGDVTTLNVTMVHGGVQCNVIPNRIDLGLDIRISPTMHIPEFKAMVDGWCQAVEGVTWEFVQETQCHYVTTLKDNPWWMALQRGAQDHGVTLDPQIFPAATDSRYVRQARIPALGVSPMRNTPVLLHCHDEALDETMFLEGIQFYVHALPHLDQVNDPEAESPTAWAKVF